MLDDPTLVDCERAPRLINFFCCISRRRVIKCFHQPEVIMPGRLNIGAFVGISAGLKPILGVDTPSADQLQYRPPVVIDRQALYARARGMTPTHRYEDSSGQYEGVILDAEDGPRFVGFLTTGRWPVPHDTGLVKWAEPLHRQAVDAPGCEVSFAPSGLSSLTSVSRAATANPVGAVHV